VDGRVAGFKVQYYTRHLPKTERDMEEESTWKEGGKKKAKEYIITSQ
jgi:hypothetical protein